MSLARTVLQNSPVNNPDAVDLTVVASGNYSTNGDTLDLTPSTFLNPAGVDVIGPNQRPESVSILESNIGGYYAQIVEAAALNGWKVKFFAPGGAEVAAAAYPAAITGGTIKLRVTLVPQDR
jgi:hypothetical protein